MDLETGPSAPAESSTAREEPRKIGTSLPGNPDWVSSVTQFAFDVVEWFGVDATTDLVQEDNDSRHTELASHQDVLLGLGHGTFVRRYDQDCAVNLGGAGTLWS